MFFYGSASKKHNPKYSPLPLHFTTFKSRLILYNIILGIESSCDETGVAIYDRQYAIKYRKCRSSTLQSQTTTHAQYGGVVPELASRDHLLHLQKLLKLCLKKASLKLTDISAFAYTRGPGLVGALLTGASYTRALAYSLGRPCVGIHHMEGHLLSPMIENPTIRPPFLGLLVSGGHTLLIEVQALGRYHIIGQSLDDAVGEAFDKSAKCLGLGYPGGYPLSQLAQQGNNKAYAFSRPMTTKAGKALSPQNRFNFSFSGLKTEVKNCYQKELLTTKNDLEKEKIKANIAASFESTVAETIHIKIQNTLNFLNRRDNHPKIRRLLVAGGVAANRTLRLSLNRLSEQNKLELYIPAPHLCTDNGDMIAYVGWLRLNNKLDAGNTMNTQASTVLPRWSLEDIGTLR